MEGLSRGNYPRKRRASGYSRSSTIWLVQEGEGGDGLGFLVSYQHASALHYLHADFYTIFPLAYHIMCYIFHARIEQRHRQLHNARIHDYDDHCQTALTG